MKMIAVGGANERRRYIRKFLSLWPFRAEYTGAV